MVLSFFDLGKALCLFDFLQLKLFLIKLIKNTELLFSIQEKVSILRK